MSRQLFLVSFLLLFPYNAVGKALTLDAKDTKQRPVSKVINLLKDMMVQMEKEAEEDETVYDKLMCWCENNKRETQGNIDNLGELLSELMERISEWTAQSAELATEVELLDKKLEKEKAALKAATELREQQLAEFRDEERDLHQALQSVKAAVIVMSKHHPGEDSFLQTSKGQMRKVATSISGLMEKHGHIFDSMLTPSQKEVLGALMQTSQSASTPLSTFLQSAHVVPNAGSYAPESGQVFGILKQMLETFDTNLDGLRDKEKERAKAFMELKKAKEAEMAAIHSQLEVKKVDLADVNEKLADALKDKEKLIAAMEGDKGFMTDLRSTCKTSDYEYKRRTRLRQQEMKIVSDAVNILNSDESHDLFTRTFNPSLTQIESKTHSNRRKEASNVLSIVGTKLHSTALLKLASRVQIDAFHKVKDAIYVMIDELKQQKIDEVKFKQYCEDSFNRVALAKADKQRRLDVASNDISDLKQQIDKQEQDIKTLNDKIAEANVQLADLAKQRDESHEDFMQQVQDARDSVKVLNDALKLLEGFYGQKVALMQVTSSLDPDPAIKTPPPSGFRTFKRQPTDKVLSMLRDIIRDTQTLETEATKDEADAKAAYMKTVGKINTSINEKNAAITEKERIKAVKSRALTDANKEHADMEAEIEQLGYEKADLHEQCDFTLKNFDIRQKSRDDEVNALSEALAILSGASLQR